MLVLDTDTRSTDKCWQKYLTTNINHNPLQILFCVTHTVDAVCYLACYVLFSWFRSCCLNNIDIDVFLMGFCFFLLQNIALLVLTECCFIAVF